MRERLVLACCVFVLCTGITPRAWGAVDAPSVDPNSPAGTEYQLPVDRARQQASGSGPGAAADAQSPLFGEGVVRQAGRTRGVRSDRGAPTSTPQTSAGSAGSSKSTAKARARAAAAPQSDPSQLLEIGAVAVGVLVIGGLAGLVSRRRSARH